MGARIFFGGGYPNSDHTPRKIDGMRNIQCKKGYKEILGQPHSLSSSQNAYEAESATGATDENTLLVVT